MAAKISALNRIRIILFVWSGFLSLGLLCEAIDSMSIGFAVKSLLFAIFAIAVVPSSDETPSLYQSPDDTHNHDDIP